MKDKNKKTELIDGDGVISKHKIQGKHSLNYDSIFKGKKEDPFTEDCVEHYNYNENFEVDKTSQYWYESIDNESYIKNKRISECVYKVLSENTSINFLNNRRKPSKVDFNNYYYLLKTHLKDQSFTNVELFNELAVYFSDNLFNMFKLLNNEWRNLIIKELHDHIGKKQTPKDFRASDLSIGTEVEFLSTDGLDEIHITGIILNTNYDELIFKIDSFERIYNVHFDDIVKILNVKYKYNLNKLNNIDFL